jgi:biopolymer transport protein TolR
LSVPKVEPMQQAFSRGTRRGRMRVSTQLAEINVVPLVDVMLVLLVIFMVAAPMMQEGYKVHLPEAKHASAASEPITVSVPASFARDGRVHLGKETISLAALPTRIQEEMSDRGTKNVMVASDDAVVVRDLMKVWDALHGAGVENVTVQTQPSNGGGRP